jgi:hypothetical protein
MANRLFNGKLLFLILLLQICFWYKTHQIKPDMYIVPEVPGELAIKASSLGDEELYFRILALQIQNSGDTFGRFSPLKLYDYKKLSAWFYLLDKLDDKSNFVPSIASYYYSQTQHVPDVKYVVDYLEFHSTKDLENKWWWLSQAVYLANFKLKDNPLALKLAYKLSKSPGKLPMWARQMPAFIHEKLGEKEQAYVIIKNIIDSHESFSQEEINFMEYFIKDRLKMMLSKEELEKLKLDK